MNQMMINNNLMINQMNQNQILQMIQKNNEQIIQMIQQIFKVQMINNMLLNQILSNNLNNNNINNNILNNMMNQMNNIMNNMNMINNSNIQTNDNYTDPWAGSTSLRLNIGFKLIGFNRKNSIYLPAPPNISVKELIEEFWKKSGITDPNEQKNIIFKINNGLISGTVDIFDCSPISKKFIDGNRISVIRTQDLMAGYNIF